MTEDLVMALRNAVERGENIEEAKISLLNAGYKREDVEKAAKALEKLTVKKGIPKPKVKPKFKPLPPPAPK